MRVSNERLTTATGSATDVLQNYPRAADRPVIRLGWRRTTGSVRGHEDREAKAGQVVQRLVHADQGPEPGMVVFLRHAEP